MSLTQSSLAPVPLPHIGGTPRREPRTFGGGVRGCLDAAGSSGRDSVGMKTTSIELKVDLVPDESSLRGRVTDAGGADYDFMGWLGLSAAIGAIVERRLALDDPATPEVGASGLDPRH